MGRARHGLVALATSVLYGCGLFSEPPQFACPRVVVLSEARQVTEFRPGPGRDLTDVRFEGEIAGMQPSCLYDDEGYVDVTVNIGFEFGKGPAAPGDVGRYTYFVAITDPEERVVAKRAFPLDVEFPERGFRVGVGEEVTQRIFYPPRPDASEYRIFIGFQLTREQLQYMRDRRQ